MNKLQRARIFNLGYVNMMDAHRKFVRDMERKAKMYDSGEDRRSITLAQHTYLAKLCWRYRRQMPSCSTPRSDPQYMKKDDFLAEMRPDKITKPE